MYKILVPTDFSSCAANATAVAIDVARKLPAEIVFQHLLADPSGNPHVLLKDVEQARAVVAQGKAQAKLEQLVQSAEQTGLKATPLLVVNKGNERIEDYIKPLSIDMVVMGSHGVTGIREFIIGSNTQRLVRHSTVPVLVVKNKPDEFSFTSIMLASTFHEDLQPAIHVISKLIEPWKGTIHLVYIGLENEKQTKTEVDGKMTMLEKAFPSQKFTRNFITTNDPEWGISYVAKDVVPDVIALTTQANAGTFLFSHSLAERLVNHERTFPVLVINTKKRA